MGDTRELLIIGCEVFCIVCLLAILLFVRAKNRKQKELREHAADRSRDDRLCAALENVHAPAQMKDSAAKNQAYQVSYHDDLEKRADAVCVQLTECGPLSQKEYLFYIQDFIRIGSDPGDELTIRDECSCGSDAQLVREDARVYARRVMPASRVYLRRGRKQYLLDDRLVRVREGDSLVIGKTSVQIRFVNP